MRSTAPAIEMEILQRALEVVRARFPRARPQCGLILGSGWSTVAGVFDELAGLDYPSITGLGVPGAPGHTGRLTWTRLFGVDTLVFRGRRHWYEGDGWTPVAIPLHILRQLGAQIVILTNAAGGVRADIKPGDLMLVSDHINLLGNPLIGAHHPAWGPRFPDMTRVYDADLAQLIRLAAQDAGTAIATGVYAAMTGPSYETPAEIAYLRTLGADAVGMSAAPEAILAHAAGLRVAAISCISNIAAGPGQVKLSHEEVIATVAEAEPRLAALLREVWRRLSATLAA